MKRTFLWAALLLNGTAPALACTGISFTARDGAFVTARTIEWGESPLPSGYVVIPRQHETVSYTPTGANGLSFRAKYGAVGLTIVRKNSSPRESTKPDCRPDCSTSPITANTRPTIRPGTTRTLSDLQYVAWILSQFSSVDEVKAATQTVRVVSIDPSVGSTVHWRIADASGKQVVLEFIDGEPRFYDNEVGVLTNSPDFPWQITNLNNYVNLHPGNAEAQRIGNVRIFPFGVGSGFLGIPGDVTPPSRFVRIAFYKATAPACETGLDAVLQSFHILNNFDIPIGIEHPRRPMLPTYRAATQWTSAIDLANRRLY